MSRKDRMAKMEKKRRDSTARGVGSLITAFIWFIVVPKLIEYYLLPMMPEGFNLEGIEDILDRWILAGIPLLVISLPKGYFGMGGRGWLVSSVLYSILKIFWILYVLNFGDVTGQIYMDDGSGWIRIDIVLSGFMYLLVALRLLKLLVIYGDYRDNRAAYIEENGKDNGPGNPSEGDGIRVKGRFY